MQSSENSKKNDLYGQLFSSLDRLSDESSIPEKDRIFTIFNTPTEMAQKKFEEHKVRCREKYGTDEGIALVSISFLRDETLRKHPELIGRFDAARELGRIRNKRTNAKNEADVVKNVTTTSESHSDLLQ